VLQEPNYKTTTVYRNGDNPDIIRLLRASYPLAYSDTKTFYKQFRGSNLHDTGYNVWKWIKEHDYLEDGDHQKVKSVARFDADNVGDCKTYANAGTGIMSHFTDAGYRFVSYRKNSTPTHVYTIFKDENGNIVPLDACWKEFGSEKPYTHKKDIWMRISYLSGITIGTPPAMHKPTAHEKNLLRLLSLYLMAYKRLTPNSAPAINLKNKIADIYRQLKNNGVRGITIGDDSSDDDTGDNPDDTTGDNPYATSSNDSGETDAEYDAEAAANYVQPTTSYTGPAAPSQTTQDLQSAAAILTAADTGYELATGKTAAPIRLQTKSNVQIGLNPTMILIVAAAAGAAYLISKS
jgi:hypothetical protein